MSERFMIRRNRAEAEAVARRIDGVMGYPDAATGTIRAARVIVHPVDGRAAICIKPGIYNPGARRPARLEDMLTLEERQAPVRGRASEIRPQIVNFKMATRAALEEDGWFPEDEEE